tara:strand:- start:28 stop:651 length:624 start_codon:yes stop_codon:yes gene_type:complete
MSQERGVVHSVIYRGKKAERVYFDPVANTTCWHRIKPAKTVRNNRNLQIFPRKWRDVIFEFLGSDSMDDNIYYLDVTSLRAHLYDLWHEYKHNSFQNYDQNDPMYEVNEGQWHRSLRRLDTLVETYGFGNYSLNISFAFKTLGVKPDTTNKYMYWTIGQKTSKSDQDCDVWDAFQCIILPNISVPHLTKSLEDNSFILGFKCHTTRN